jgi:hypothetical protein
MISFEDRKDDLQEYIYKKELKQLLKERADRDKGQANIKLDSTSENLHREDYISYIYDETKSLDSHKMNTEWLEAKTLSELKHEVNRVEERVLKVLATDKANEILYNIELEAAMSNNGAHITNNKKFNSLAGHQGVYGKNITYKDIDDINNIELILEVAKARYNIEPAVEIKNENFEGGIMAQALNDATKNNRNKNKNGVKKRF